jgi:phosphoglycerate dehydrogenase-like enzyme
MNLLFHYEAGPNLRAALERKARSLRILYCDQADEERFDRVLPEIDVLWHVLKPVSRAHIERAPRLRLIQKIGVGVNTIDLEAARASGIAVCNMPGTNTNAVAEMTLLLMLAALRRVLQLDALCRSRIWVPDQTLREGLAELSGRTVGFIGFGAVPQRLAPILSALGANTIYTARSNKAVPYPRLELGSLLAKADIISVHLPLTSETLGLVGRSEIARMKPGAILVNTARGGIVDETALHDALTTGHLSAAGLDVFEDEPVRVDHPLLSLSNVITAPHVAWLTNETWQRSLDIALYNTGALAAGEPLHHRII